MTRPYRNGAAGSPVSITPAHRLALGLSATYAGSLSEIPLDPGAGGRSIAESALQPGDVLVSTTRDRVSGLIRGVTDSQVSHAAVVLKNGQVAESLGSGVGVKSISEALSDDVLAVALRPVPALTSTQVDQLDAWVRTQIGVPYNYIGVGGQGLFRLTSGACDHLGFAREACERARHQVVMSTAGDNSWFCSELVIQAFQRVGHTLGDQPAMSQAPSDIAAMMGSRLAYVGHARYDATAFSQSLALSRGLSATPALDIAGLIRAAVADGLTEAEARALYADMGVAPPIAGSAGFSARSLDASAARTLPQARMLGSINDARGRAVMRAIDQAIQRAGLGAGTTVQALVASLGSRPLTTVGFGPAANAGLFVAGSVGAGFLICSDGRVGVYIQGSAGVGWVGSATVGGYVTVMRGGPETFDGRSQVLTVSAGLSEGPGIEYQHIMTMGGQFAGFAFGISGSLGVPLLTAIEGTWQISEGAQRSGSPLSAIGQSVGSYSRAISGAQGITRSLTGDRVVEVRLRGFIPSPAVALTDERVPLAGGCYVGDGRTFSYSGGTHRFQLTGRVTVPAGGGGGSVAITDRDWGESKAFPDSMTVRPAGRPFWWRDLLPGATPSRVATHPVADDNLVLRPKAAGFFSAIPAGHTIIQALVIGANPLAAGSPTIDADLALDFYYDAGALKCRVSGDHDGFPAYELYLDGRLVYSHDPVAQSQTPVSLFPPAEFDVDFVTALSAGSLGYGRGFDAPSSAAPAGPGTRDGAQGAVRWRVTQLDGPHPAGAAEGTFQPVSFEALGRIEAPTGGEVSARFPVTFEASGSQIRNVRIADPTVQTSAVGWTLNVDNTVDVSGGPATLRFTYRFASGDGAGDTLTLTYVLNPNGEVKRTASWASTGGAPGSAKPLSAWDDPRRAYA
jgi:cell wall-associated NlpC family hydrolase